ncbi:protease-4 [Frankineae bacterium MT45]|nr:protease-4 [Frankineae bacterium MT45]
MPSHPAARPLASLTHRSPVILELDLTSPPASPEPGDRLAGLLLRGRPQLSPTLRALHEAGEDRRVGGLIVKVGGHLPWALAHELRQGIRRFVAGGKPALAWAESFADGADMAAYLLAAACGEVWLQPGGGLGLLGVGIETTFVRGVLDRLGIEPQLEQRYEFKNAADRIMRTGYTDEHRLALDRLAESIFDSALEAIAADRSTPVAELRQLIDSGPRTATEAREAGLVDRLGYRDEAYAAIRAQVGADSELLFADRWRPRHRPPSLPGRRRGHVALVEVRGGIASGRSRRSPLGSQTGSDSIAMALRSAARDEQAKAVVLRVDSPGGSAVASEVIWRAVCLLRDAGKPVIVSMGEAAASGGYYIACPADVIVAQPATLTGSIGVFGGKFVTRELRERIGFTSDSVQHGDRSLMFSSRRRFSEAELERLAAMIDAIYDDFVAKVAAGRSRPASEIEGLARGRVWTGADALGVGLVDELGGLRDAVRIARERGGLPDRAPVRHPVHVPALERLGRPKNSEDPRAQLGSRLPSLGGVTRDLAAGLGLPMEIALRMPEISLR